VSVVRKDLTDYDLLSDSIYTSMPGSMRFSGGNIVWTDPFAVRKCVHLVDAETGKELYAFGSIGDGPKEFNAIDLSFATPSHLLITDQSKPLQALASVDSLREGKASIDWMHHEPLGSLRRIQLTEDTYLNLTLGSITSPFVIESKESKAPAGKYPLNEAISNGFNFYQGEILYNPDKRVLFYSTFSIPYIAMYTFNDDGLQLGWEKMEAFEHYIKDGNLHLSDNAFASNFHDIALTKDYIIMVRRDEKREGEQPVPTVSRDMNTLPSSLFIYNYQYELQQIIYVGNPVLRIAGDYKTNRLCAIIVAPEFSLIKFDI
jgi:hypothetical protein